MTERRITVLLGISAVLVLSGVFHLVVFAVDDRPSAELVSWSSKRDNGRSGRFGSLRINIGACVSERFERSLLKSTMSGFALAAPHHHVGTVQQMLA